MTLPLAPTPELSQTAPAREHLRQARYHLGLARDLLDRPTPEYRAAAAHIATSYQRALSAITTWHGDPGPEGADVRELGRRAINFANVLRTPLRQALAVLPTLRSVGAKERLSVHDREGVETAWYTARNLYRAVAGELPAGVRAGHAAPAEASAEAPAEPRATSRRSETGSARHDQQGRRPASADRAAPAPLAASL